ncbi:MAG TPA: HTH domain-containing protein [Candidatus Anaerofilum faecale]|nr:HTH domain-containing protein [Candidatus Anaerofilum faecale]
MNANWRRDAIVEILRQNGKVKAKDLAEQFQVTRQTIYQDVTALSLRYDICTDRGRGGGIYLLQSKRKHRRYLTSIQAEVLQQILPTLSIEKSLIVQSVLYDFSS